MTVRSVIELLMDITSHPGTLSEVAAAPGRSLQFDNRQMRAALGQWELVSLEDGLRCEVDHFRGLAN